jgi:hypothetical protein
MAWHDYNESVVEGGWTLFDLGFAAHWSRDLERMNAEKMDRPCERKYLLRRYLAER